MERFTKFWPSWECSSKFLASWKCSSKFRPSSNCSVCSTQRCSSSRCPASLWSSQLRSSWGGGFLQILGPPSGGGPGFVSPGPHFMSSVGGEPVHQGLHDMLSPAGIPPPFPPSNFMSSGREHIAPSHNFPPPGSGPPLYAPPPVTHNPSNFSSHSDIGGAGFVPPRVTIPPTSVAPVGTAFPEGKAPSSILSTANPRSGGSPDMVDMEVTAPEDYQLEATPTESGERKLCLSVHGQLEPDSPSHSQLKASPFESGRPEFGLAGNGAQNLGIRDSAPSARAWSFRSRSGRGFQT